jgi:hypothetical protein
VIQPDCVLDHLGRIAEATIGVGRRHAGDRATCRSEAPT